MDKLELLGIANQISEDPELKDAFREVMIRLFDLRNNPFHPLVFVHGTPEIGEGTYIGLFSEINAKGGAVKIGKNCDIASFVSINVADSHKMSIGLADSITRGNIELGDNVFVGSHSFIGGDTSIGNNSVVAAGTMLINGGEIPPFSLVVGNPAKVKPGYYRSEPNPA